MKSNTGNQKAIICSPAVESRCPLTKMEIYLTHSAVGATELLHFSSDVLSGC